MGRVAEGDTLKPDGPKIDSDYWRPDWLPFGRSGMA
jgi:hypothetical protein